MKIYNLGSLNIDYVYAVDHFVAAGETLSSKGMAVFPGGKGLNQSVALAKAGAAVIHGAVAGNDGKFLVETLTAAGVDASRIKTVDGTTGHAIIQVDKSGQNCIMLFAGTNYAVDEEYIREFLRDAEENDILLLQNEVSNLRVAFEIAHGKKMQIAFNPSPYHDDLKNLPLSYVKWWFCNEIEGAAFFGSSDPEEIADAFVKQFPDNYLLLTLGKDGSMFVSSEQRVRQPIYEVQTVDTTAAGDTFTGYFLSALTEGSDVAFSLDLAARAAAITVSRSGASSSIPVRNEVDASMI